MDSTPRASIAAGWESERPIYVGTDTRGNHRRWWKFKGSFYSTFEDLASDEVAALIEESENRKRIKIAKAKALAAMSRSLAETPRSRNSIPAEVKIAVWRRDGGRCRVCGAEESLQFDHDIPHSMGGADTVQNLQLLCADCNARKGATLGGEELPTPAGVVEDLVVCCGGCGAKNRVERGRRSRCGRCRADLGIAATATPG